MAQIESSRKPDDVETVESAELIQFGNRIDMEVIAAEQLRHLTSFFYFYAVVDLVVQIASRNDESVFPACDFKR